MAPAIGVPSVSRIVPVIVPVSDVTCGGSPSSFGDEQALSTRATEDADSKQRAAMKRPLKNLITISP